MFGRKARTIIAMQYRIEDLEERLCPCEGHQWKQTRCDCDSLGGIDYYTYKCRRCGKTITSIFGHLESKEE